MIIKCNLCNKSVEIAENLTKPEIKTLKFIQNYRKEHNKSPSYRDISQGLGYKAQSYTYNLVYSLINKNYLTKSQYKKRSIIILKELPCEIS